MRRDRKKISEIKDKDTKVEEKTLHGTELINDEFRPYITAGLYIRECREKLGLSVEKLAEKLDLHPNQVVNLENGYIRIKLDKTMANIYKILEIKGDSWQKEYGYLPIIGKNDLEYILKNTVVNLNGFLMDEKEKLKILETLKLMFS